jgi:hypothetical protein
MTEFPLVRSRPAHHRHRRRGLRRGKIGARTIGAAGPGRPRSPSSVERSVPSTQSIATTRPFAPDARSAAQLVPPERPWRARFPERMLRT